MTDPSIDWYEEATQGPHQPPHRPGRQDHPRRPRRRHHSGGDPVNNRDRAHTHRKKKPMSEPPMKFERITTKQALDRARQAEVTLKAHGLEPRQMIAGAGCTCCVPNAYGLYNNPGALDAWEAWERYMFLAGEEIA